MTTGVLFISGATRATRLRLCTTGGRDNLPASFVTRWFFAVSIAIVIFLALSVRLASAQDDESAPPPVEKEAEPGDEPDATGAPAPLKSIENAQRIGEGIRWVFEQVAPAVVAVRGAKTGTGFIVDPDGYIVTSRANVGGLTSVSVMVGHAPGKTYQAKLISSDGPSDLAVIKIEGKNFPYLRVGDSDATKVGDIVLAFNAHAGIAPTFAFGIISYKNRTRSGVAGVPLLQTSAPLDQNNMGGPLVNADLEVIGVNNTILSRRFIGIAYAIPINNFKQKLQPQLPKK